MAPGILVSDASNGSFEKSMSSVKASSVSTVFHHSLVTNDIDPLRFDAAASLQLKPKNVHVDSAKLGHELIASPYNETPNLLDLTTLDVQEQLLAKAFTHFKPTKAHYAEAKYEDAFNWDSVLKALKDLAADGGHLWESQAFYIVYFRSELKVDADKGRLAKADNLAHAEAMESGGLLKYWFGKAEINGKNLATCIWQSKDHAIRGGRGPWHQEAKRLIDQYKWIEFKRSWLWIGDDIANWNIIASEDSEKTQGVVKDAITRARGLDH